MTAVRRQADRIRRACGNFLFSSPLYRALPGSVLSRPARNFAAHPPDPWPGDAARGAAIIEGKFRFSGREITIRRRADGPSNAARKGLADWAPKGADDAWLAQLHGFGWLDDLRAVGTDAARRCALADIASWLDGARHHPAIACRADITGHRLYAWLTHFGFLETGMDQALRRRVMTGLAREARHLVRALRFAPGGAARLTAVKGAVYATHCLPARRGARRRAVARLEREIASQILADGGHRARNPAILAALLRDFIDLRALLTAADAPVPDALRNAIDRMAPMLRFFRHGDGGLALFNGAREEAAWLLDMTLARADAPGKPFAYAPHSGFQRLAAGRCLVLLDSGAPDPAPESTAHAGTLSFEMSVGKQRLIVNCGAHAGDEPAWRQGQRATAAHSTLVLADTNSAEIAADGGLGRRPDKVDCRRNEADDGIWIESVHDGYLAAFGFRHRRRLWLSAAGDDLRGEDNLEPEGARAAQSFAVRFHLHPSVKVSLAENGTQALLRLPGGEGWRMRAAGGVLEIADSVYLGAEEQPRRSEQIVITGTAEPATAESGAAESGAAESGAAESGAAPVKWAFQRIPRRAGIPKER
ncbi:MAG: heparinase II/III family protein [Alphaproteobacteria bacterium]